MRDHVLRRLHGRSDEPVLWRAHPMRFQSENETKKMFLTFSFHGLAASFLFFMEVKLLF